MDSPTFSAIFQALPGAYVLLTPALVIEAVSDSYLAATLTRREDLLGRYLFAVFPDNPTAPEAYAVRNLRASLEQVLATGEPHEMPLQPYDVPDPTRPGQFVTRYWLPRNTPVLDAQGRVRYLLHGVVNVTEQLWAEAQLRASQGREQQAQADRQQQVQARQQAHLLNWALEARVAERTQALQRAQAEANHQRARLNQLFQQVPEGIAVLHGPDLVFELVNPAFQQFLPQRALLGHPFGEALPELANQAVSQTLRHVYATGQAHAATGHCIPLARPGDGVLEDRYFTYSLQARRDEQGTVDGVMVFATEVTPLIRAGQLTRATLDSATAIVQGFEAVRDAAGQLVDFRWTLVNEAAAAQYDVDLIGQQLLVLNPGVVAAGVFARFAQVLATGQPQCSEQEYRHEQYNGWFEQSVVRLGDGVVSTTTDITARKQAEQALHAANAQLRRTNVDLDTFVYTASHDLKAPITNLEGLLDALQHHLPAAVQAEETTSQLLGMMLGATERFRLTLDQLTDVSRWQQEQDLPLEHVPLAPVVEAVRLDMLLQLQQAGAQLHLDLSPDLSVQFAPKNLRSVVYNLLSNAVKYRHPDRTPLVTLRAAPSGSQVAVLEVQDNGLGLNAHQQARLFGLFQRLHTHVEGTGVGLYMVKRMVENAGGTIAVESQAGIGTTFRLTLPV